MAEDNEKDKVIKYNQGSELREMDTLVEGRVPDTFKTSRDAALQLSKVERDLFTEMEERESGNYVISGLTKKVTEYDFASLTFAFSQILYNQSYLSGNADVNSGITRELSDLSEQLGTNVYRGEIDTTLNDLCRLAYGTEPAAETKKKMAVLIKTFNDTPVKVKFPNGDLLENYLCHIDYKYTRKKDKAVAYHLILNPIFTSRIKDQFGELPQNIMALLDAACKKRGQRKTAAHVLLLRWLSVQDKRYDHTLTIDSLIRELRMEDDFKKNRGRAEKQLLSVCDVMTDATIKIINGYDIAYATGRRKGIEKITFHLNQTFIRLPKAEPDDNNKTKKKRGKREA